MSPREKQEEPFELLQLLGSGGFAHTYKARVLKEDLIDEFGTDIVAVKIPLSSKKESVLRRELVMNALLHERLKDLQAANLVRYLGFASFDNQIVMVMQYLSDGSLRKLIGGANRQSRLPVEDAVRIAEGVLNGLDVIHREHVFHRDIKPENILMDGKTPKIADLGISRMLESDELASTTTGTIYYMSPEILFEEGASFTADIWSLGVTLYEMVTGKLPFGRVGTPIGTMTDLIRRADPVPACEVCADVPQALGRIIGKSLERRPTDRYASAREMADALRSLRDKKDEKLEKELAAIREAITGVQVREESESKLLDIMKKYPKEPRAYQYLGEYYNRCQRYADAIVAFKKGIDQASENALLHWDLALAYQKKGQNSEAVKTLQKAIALGLDPSLQRHANTLLKALQR